MSKWYEKAVFYHMYPLGMVGAPKQNTQEEVSHRFEELNLWIPHMKELGVTAVYIGPLFESSTHGYDTKDYQKVDRRLGSNEDFAHFVSLCHQAGIRVVVDGVFNHSGREFFAFRDIQEKREASPYRDWYKGVNFGWGSPLGDSFGYEAWQGHYELPCFNLRNPAVSNYLFDVIQYWVDAFDIDGIRLDCANILDFSFMEEMRRRTTQMKDDFWLMGEVIHGEYGRWVRPSMLHSVTNYELHKSIYSAHNDHNYFELAHNVRRLEAIAPFLYTFVDNHDEDRIASKLLLREHLPLVYLCLFTLPGIPSIYYGSEWGIEGRRSRTSDEALRPKIDLTQLQTERATNWDFSLEALISTLSKLHSSHRAYHAGSYKELLLTNRQYAFAREKDGEVMISAVNNDDKDAQLFIPLPCPISGNTLTDLISGQEFLVENGKLVVNLTKYQGIVVNASPTS
ncbi:MAG: alpha-amylase family glycosyl hydrolase [bacterium]|nr:alpha-amylase family glycosyl hydrolase [bacterium]